MDKLLKKIIWLIIGAPLIYLALVWNKLPEQVGIHFNIHGNPDRYGSKEQLWIYIPVIIIVGISIYLLLPAAYKIDPKKTAMENRPRLQRLAFAITTFLSFVSCIIIHSALNEGIRLNMQIVVGSIGLLWCVTGNYLYNIRPNYFAGFRVPWALSNEENWKKTHWLGGKIFFAGGLLLFLAAFLTSGATLIFIFITVALITTIIPGIYSYSLYRKTKKDNTTTNNI